MEIKQYQPGEKAFISRTNSFTVSKATKSVRGGFDTKKKEFDYCVYQNGKKKIMKIF